MQRKGVSMIKFHKIEHFVKNDNPKVDNKEAGLTYFSFVHRYTNNSLFIAIIILNGILS